MGNNSQDNMKDEPLWLDYARRLQFIAQAGLTYTDDKYDRERFRQIREISAKIMEDYTDMEQEKIEDNFSDEIGYPTPKIDVRAAIFKDGKILLVKEKLDGQWSLPGGWADIEGSLKENIIKESREEAGAEVKPKRIIAIYDRGTKSEETISFYGIYKIFVECDFVEMNFSDNIETSAAEFFQENDLPELSRERNTEREISLCFEARKKDVHEADFD